VATRKRTFNLPTLNQLHQALPVVSAGFSVLSSLPLKPSVRHTLSVAAAVTGGAASGAAPVAHGVLAKQFAKALATFNSLPPGTDAETVREKATDALELASALLEKS